MAEFTLDNFYTSKPWINMTRQIKLERINSDGLLICEHCGKPIIRAYDAICHHKTYLTEQNVNDFNISLNPENIAVVHHVCHNHIHEKLGYIRKEIYLVYGSPMCGKYEWVESVLKPGDLVIDIDNIWECVSGCSRYIKPQRLNAVVFGIRDYLIDSVRVRRGKWNNAYIVGGYPLISERERLAKELGAREIYIESTLEDDLAKLERLAFDENDARNIGEWKKFTEDWWRRYRPPY